MSSLDQSTSSSSASVVLTPATRSLPVSNAMASTPAGRTPEKTMSPNASFNETFGSEMVKISVGEGSKKQEFHIHKRLLCQKAPVFDRMFSGNFAEGQIGEALLPEDDPKAFDMFASWLYRSTVKDLGHEPGDFIDLFAFAEKYGIVCLMDSTMDSFIGFLIKKKTRPGINHFPRAYARTHYGSKLRLFLSRIWAYGVLNEDDNGKWASSTLVPTGEKAQEILIDGMTQLRGLNQSKSRNGKKLLENPKLAPLCDYHQHGKDEVCPYAKQKRKLDDSNC
ncbi:hypothetical protein ACEPPN_015691 [Leptodophora sp. 'Broadleaf-Isolate-01']